MQWAIRDSRRSHICEVETGDAFDERRHPRPRCRAVRTERCWAFLTIFQQTDGGQGGDGVAKGAFVIVGEWSAIGGGTRKAERRGEEWILNGEKCFIANGSVGKLFFVSTRTNPDVAIRDGTTVFMVPSGTPGFRIGKVFNKSGWRFYQNAELIFENTRVPHANVVGEVNGGVRARSGPSAEFGDLELAANALGVCEAAVESAMQRAHTHRLGGLYLMEHQLIQLKLNEMHMLTEALRSFVMRTAWEMDREVRGSANPILVMNFSSDVIQRVTRLNLEIQVNAGATMPAAADKLVRDGIIWTHLAGDATQRIKVMKRFPRW